MKIKTLLAASIGVGLVCCMPTAGYSIIAVSCPSYSAANYNMCHALSGGQNCAESSELHYGDSAECFNVNSCDKCLNGLKLVPKIENKSCGTILYYSCQEQCDCTTGDWKDDIKNGVQSRTYCDDNTCESGIEFRCAAGWYGSASLSRNNCTRCPSYGNVAGQSPAGSGFISKCFIPAGSIFTDDTGTGEFTTDCNYKDDGPSIKL